MLLSSLHKIKGEGGGEEDRKKKRKKSSTSIASFRVRPGFDCQSEKPVYSICVTKDYVLTYFLHLGV